MIQTAKATELKFQDEFRDGSLPGRSAREKLLTEVTPRDAAELATFLQRFQAAFDRDLNPPVQDQVFVDKRTGIAFVEPYVPVRVHVLQDCFDTEAHLRQSVHWQNLPPVQGAIELLPIPEFRPAAIGGAIADALGEFALSGYRGTLEGHKGEVVYSKVPTLFIANTAPRNGRPHEQGAPFVYARLGFNVFYFGTNSGELEFLKDFIVGSPVGINIDECTTYRSRFLGKRAGEWRQGDVTHFGEPIDPKKIPAAERGTILWVDNFGNVKLNFTAQELFALNIRPGDPVRLSSGANFAKATFVSKLEDGENGDLLIAVGSSRSNFGRSTASNNVDIYLKGNPSGDSAAQLLCRAFEIDAHASERQLLPLSGLKLKIE